jgi:hypothetical protein
VQEINVSRAGDPVHAGDKALTWETPVQRGRVNRYVIGTINHTCDRVAMLQLEICREFPIWNSCADEKRREIQMVKVNVIFK